MDLHRSLLTYAMCLLVVAVQPADAASKPTSEFTSTDTKKYKLVASSEGSGTATCPGFGGYKILFQIGDDRSWVDLDYDGQPVSLASGTFEQCKGQKPWKANTVVQWRGFRNGKQFSPYGLIFRMNSENPIRSQKPFDTLVVVKLDGANSKVVGHAAGNTEAEQLADRLCAPQSPTDRAAKAPDDRPPATDGQRISSDGSIQVSRNEDGSSILFPNGQKFALPAGKGLLGPSDHPTEAKPFELEEGWLVVLNEQPVAGASIVHMYLRGQGGKWTELPNIQQRILKIATSGKSRMRADFVRAENLQTGSAGKALLHVETFKDGDQDPITIPIAISRTGNLTYGGRGE